ncbi:hypothetical protein CALVIDRAFT_438222 [Calocera viscosa TUFC12733]|uniref:Uncharacterized protein n=1 Tax=Calocera viscosa (strain TUFC12733) TaxID=1330018 RepID=A0A167FTJ6_CALVF|nr:hypothetical protein CALVIDRAFT_438222 [Calocera viscosa TUFC12733]
MRQCLRVKYRVAQLKWRFEDEDHRYDPGALATTINDWNDEKDRRRAEIEGKSANGDEKKQVLLSIPAIEEGRAIPTGETHDAPALSVPLPSEARASSVPTAIDTRTSTLPPPIDNPTSTLPPPINAPAFSVPPPTDAPASIVPLPTVDDAGNVAPAGSTDPDKKAAEPDITPPGMGVAAGNVLPNAETTVTDTPPVASPENTDSVNVGHKEEHAPDVPEGQDPYEGQDDAEMEDVPPSKPGYGESGSVPWSAIYSILLQRPGAQLRLQRQTRRRGRRARRRSLWGRPRRCERRQRR